MKQNTMQVILGAGGAIGKDLAKELKNYTPKVRLVSRNPQKINETDELFPGDLTDGQFVEKAIEGAKVAYLIAGLPYRLKTWKQQWPLIMRNVISACKKHRCKLVFFDNMYLYDRDYEFDSSKFETVFNIKPTPAEEALKQIADAG